MPDSIQKDSMPRDPKKLDSIQKDSILQDSITPQKTIKIFISALEYSANIHLKFLLEKLDKKCVKYELCGIFDGKIIENFSPNFLPSDFRIMGFFGAFGLIFKFFKVQKELAKIAQSADLAIFMDSSSFNIPLIKKIRKIQKDLNKSIESIESAQSAALKNSQNSQNFPKIIYYILPQAWAWKAYRAKILSSICDELWSILPFELQFYKSQNAPNLPIFLGHPLLDEIAQKDSTNLIESKNLQIESKSLQAPKIGDKIAFLPGSRKQEIAYIFPHFAKAAIELKKRGYGAILLVPKSFENKDLSKIYGENLGEFELEFCAQNAFTKSKFAFICSGTASLEAAIFGLPCILAYKARAFDFYIARLLVRLNFIGLGNLILQAAQNDNKLKERSFLERLKGIKSAQKPPLCAEILQNDLNAENLLKEFENFDYSKFNTAQTLLLKTLKHGSAELCAEKILEFFKNKYY